MASSTPQTQTLITTARMLWAGSFQGALSTHSAAHEGYPFGSSVPYCLGRNGQALLLLSPLAQHARNLLANPHCGLLLTGPGDADIQQRARLSGIADCMPNENIDDADKQRYFRYFPHTRPYFEQLNFQFFRLQPRHFHLNAGFAAARWFTAKRIIRNNPLPADLEQTLITEFESTPRELPALQAKNPNGGDVRVCGIDAEGIDLQSGQGVVRLNFSDPASKTQAIISRVRELAGGPEALSHFLDLEQNGDN